MITHYIIMSSSYSNGCRIALHYALDEAKEDKSLANLVNDIMNECGRDVSISTHFIQTESETWESVVKKDLFFEDVVVIDSKSKFIELIKKDRVLTGIDIAKYILTKVGCTHLKLEKLVYLCYADYLCKTGEKLYTDAIYAYKYGPVVKTVYDKYKDFGYRQIDEKILIRDKELELPARSRILFAIDGLSKLAVIEQILQKYGGLTAGELVDITHKEDTPWEKTGRGLFYNKIIEDKCILKYHKNEQI